MWDEKITSYALADDKERMPDGLWREVDKRMAMSLRAFASLVGIALAKLVTYLELSW